MARKKSTKEMAVIPSVSDDVRIEPIVENGPSVKMVDTVVELTGAIIKGLYEAEANAFTDALFGKLGGIEANATADQTDAEIEAAYNNEVAKVSGAEITAAVEAAVRRYSPADIKAFIDQHASGGGVGITIDPTVTVDGVTFQVARIGGGAAVAVAGSAAAGFTITPGAGAFIAYVWATSSTDNATVTNGSGEFEVTIDNSANSNPRPVAVKLYDAANNTEVDPAPLGNYPIVPVSGNSTTVTIGNISGNYSSGIKVYLN